MQNIQQGIVRPTKVKTYKRTGILKTIGNTPLVKLKEFSKINNTNIFGKLEFFNPGLSAKDRVAIHIIEKAEAKGLIKPDATIIDATSGNTGLALAIVCKDRGYKCLLTLSSKASEEKREALRLMGAELIICPADVASDDPRSYYEQARIQAESRPNAFYANQNFNYDNVEAHYSSTGPEIWKQTDGKITHLIASVGTGGTLSGSAKFLKEQNPNIKVIGVDAFGSVLTKFHQTGMFDPDEISSYKMEGVGKTIIPDNVRFEVIDEFIQVTDKVSAHKARELKDRDGIFAGHSAGAVMAAIEKYNFKPKDKVVAIFSDHGSKYMSTIYNNEWMKKLGFME